MTGTAKLNACHNREPFKATYPGQTGWNYFRDGFGNPTRSEVMRDIPHVMSTDCQYSVRTPDPKCTGCRWNQQETNHDGHNRERQNA